MAAITQQTIDFPLSFLNNNGNDIKYDLVLYYLIRLKESLKLTTLLRWYFKVCGVAHCTNLQKNKSTNGVPARLPSGDTSNIPTSSVGLALS